jgi:hypothetical protein
MPRVVRALMPLVLAGAISSCSAPTEPTQLSVDLTSTPGTATAVASKGVFYTIKGDDTHPDQTIEYPWKASFTVSLQETGGLAVDITAVNVKVQQASGGIVITPTTGTVERYQFNSSASGNRLAAKGSASVGFEVWYDLPNQGREALVTVGFSFRDDDSSTYSDTLDVRVSQ